MAPMGIFDNGVYTGRFKASICGTPSGERVYPLPLFTYRSALETAGASREASAASAN
jgi:hypothetical protein